MYYITGAHQAGPIIRLLLLTANLRRSDRKRSLAIIVSYHTAALPAAVLKNLFIVLINKEILHIHLWMNALCKYTALKPGRGRFLLVNKMLLISNRKTVQLTLHMYSTHVTKYFSLSMWKMNMCFFCLFTYSMVTTTQISACEKLLKEPILVVHNGPQHWDVITLHVDKHY